MDAVAVFQTPTVKGETLFHQRKNGVVVMTQFTALPPGEHGFHIHRAGDLRGQGCLGACDHWHKGGRSTHGGPPTSSGPRHTGDLGNVAIAAGHKEFETEYFLADVKVEELLGRALIVHADPDDLGKGPFEDSLTTGHSGQRIACAIIGRVASCGSSSGKKSKGTTRKAKN